MEIGWRPRHAMAEEFFKERHCWVSLLNFMAYCFAQVQPFAPLFRSIASNVNVRIFGIPMVAPARGQPKDPHGQQRLYFGQPNKLDRGNISGIPKRIPS